MEHTRMRIIIRVIASQEHGLGHVYRAMTLAEEFERLGHEVRFACGNDALGLVEQIVGVRYGVDAGHSSDYALFAWPTLVINDILDTSEEYVEALKDAGRKVINFEDLGPGADHADLVINALFQTPQREGDHYLWGIDYFFLRDEFVQAQPSPWNNQVDNVLVSYGGTDPTDLTWKTVNAIAPYCREHKITMYIVVGPGYTVEREAAVLKLLWDWGVERVFFVRETGVMAQIMSRCQLAFCSNGRTVYELAHMHVPAFVIAHHERENTHDFATRENGFANMGVYREGLMYEMRRFGEWAAEAADVRRECWEAMQRFDLSGNKERVARRILEACNER